MCGWALRTRPHQSSGTIYTCAHSGSAHEGDPSVNIATYILDSLVWDLAVTSMRDPAFFDRVLADTDAMGGPAVRAQSLRTQIAELIADHAKLFKQLQRLDSDDPDDEQLIHDYHQQLKDKKRQQTDREQSLAAVESILAAEAERRANIEAFHAYAAKHATTLDQKTPIERRRILLALHTRVRVGPGDTLGRVDVRFDIRTLPGALYGVGEYRRRHEGVRPVRAGEDWTVDSTDTPGIEVVEADNDAELATGGAGGATLPVVPGEGAGSVLDGRRGTAAR